MRLTDIEGGEMVCQSPRIRNVNVAEKQNSSALLVSSNVREKDVVSSSTITSVGTVKR